MKDHRKAPLYSVKNLDLLNRSRYPPYDNQFKCNEMERMLVNPFRTYGVNYMISPSALDYQHMTGHAVCVLQDGKKADFFDALPKSWDEVIDSMDKYAQVIFIGPKETWWETQRNHQFGLHAFQVSKAKVAFEVDYVLKTAPTSFLAAYYRRLGALELVDDARFVVIGASMMLNAKVCDNPAIVEKSTHLGGGVEHAGEQGVHAGELPRSVAADMGVTYFSMQKRPELMNNAQTEEEVAMDMFEAMQDFIADETVEAANAAKPVASVASRF
jgi:hypothetical protein